VLQCIAKGEKPIGILWNMNNKRLDGNTDPRYLFIILLKLLKKEHSPYKMPLLDD